jgi:hypothetical protein
MLWNAFFPPHKEHHDQLLTSVLQIENDYSGLAAIQYIKSYYLIRYGASNHDFLEGDARRLFHKELAAIFVEKLQQRLTLNIPGQARQFVAMALDFQASYHVPASLLTGFYLDHLNMENSLKAIGWNIYGLTDAYGKLRQFRSLHDATLAFIHNTSSVHGLALLVKHGKNGSAWAAQIPGARHLPNQIETYQLSVLEV